MNSRQYKQENDTKSAECEVEMCEEQEKCKNTFWVVDWLWKQKDMKGDGTV